MNVMEIMAPDMSHIIDLAKTNLKYVAQVFNVQGYGAKGDAKNDDTDAIQKAIDEAGAAGGGIVYFPTGTYLISNTIINSFNDVRLVGSGMGGASRIISNNDIVLVQLGVYVSGPWDSSKWRYFQEIHNLDFGNRDPAPTNANVLIAACQFVRIENCSFTQGATGVKILRYSDHGKYSNNVFYGLSTCLHYYGQSGVSSTGCRIDGNDFQGGNIGILLDGTYGDIQIHDNTFIGTLYGIKCVPDTDSTYSNKIGIYGNDFDGAETYGIYLESSNHILINSNNIAVDATGTGVYLKNCINVEVGPVNVTNALTGIHLVGGSNNSVADCMMINIIGNGILLDSNVTGTILDNNRITSYSDCIKIADSTCTGNKIRNNKCFSTAGKLISTFDNDYTNIISSDISVGYKLFDPVARPGNRSMIGTFEWSRSFSGVTSSSAYTNLIRVDVDSYCGGIIDVTFSNFISGVGAGAHRNARTVFTRSSTGLVEFKSISDTQSDIVFDFNYDVTTTPGSFYVAVKRNAAQGGTGLSGIVVVRCTGAIASIADV